MNKSDLVQCLKDRDNQIISQADKLAELTAEIILVEATAELRIRKLMAQLVDERAGNARKLNTIILAGTELAKLRGRLLDCKHDTA